MQTEYIWHAEVRGYELDNQGIVNNANYFHYFNHTRVKHLLALGLDWDEYAKQGLNLVLAEVSISFKAPLVAHDEFYITSTFTRKGRMLISCEQKLIRKPDEKLMAAADNLLACVNTKTGKPCMPEEIIQALFQDTKGAI